MSSPDDETFPEVAIDSDKIFGRGGRNLGDEDFAVFKCPTCATIYLIDYEVDTVYVDATNLARRFSVNLGTATGSFDCVSCGKQLPTNEPWIGERQGSGFRVTWKNLLESPWAWIAADHPRRD